MYLILHIFSRVSLIVLTSETLTGNVNLDLRYII